MKKAKKVTLIVFAIFMFLSIFIISFFFILIEPSIKIAGLSALDENRLNIANKTISILGNYNNLIYENINANKSHYVKLENVPKNTVNAFIAIEDKRFYNHHGIDWTRVLSASLRNIKSLSFSEGASTISQQLIKNTHLTNKKTISRKIQEMRIARDLERKYTKEEILEFYLNVLYFGHNTYGIENASLTFFDKPSSFLTLSEGALLAGIINNPSAYNPYKNYERTIKRRNLVLNRMLEQKYVTKDEYDVAINEKIVLKETNKPQIPQSYYSTINESKEILNVAETEIYENIAKIETSIDIELSKRIEEIINSIDLENTIIKVLVVDNKNSEVLADCSTLDNDLSRLRRSPGSTIKPILCYAPALELGLVSPITPILDEETNFRGWTPSNYKDKYYGWTSVENSLIHSLNIPAIKLLEQVGLYRAKNFANKMGLTFDPKDDNLSLALGSMTNGLSLTEIVGAYSAFANYGTYSKPQTIKKIVDKNGKTIFERKIHKINAISPSTAFLISDMLNNCAKSGTAKLINSQSKNVSAKTGTVGNKDGNTDAYCIAYTPKYTVGVWIGSKNGLMSNEISGGNHPTKIASRVLNILNDTTTFSRPKNIVYREIDTRALYNEHKVLLASNEIKSIHKKGALFIDKYAPKEYSTPNSYMDNKSILDDFDDFKIIYRLVN